MDAALDVLSRDAVEEEDAIVGAEDVVGEDVVAVLCFDGVEAFEEVGVGKEVDHAVVGHDVGRAASRATGDEEQEEEREEDFFHG